MAKIIDGKKLAREEEKELARKVETFKKKTGVVPKLVAIMVGDNPASKLYLRVKEKAAKRVGILFEKKKFAGDIDAKEVIRFIKTANKDSSVHGIMVQLPLPKLSAKSYPDLVSNRSRTGQLKAILGAIAPSKDVDCLTPENLGLLMMGKPRFLPATVRAIMEALNWVLKSPAEISAPFGGKATSESTTLASSVSTTFCAIKGSQVTIVGAGNLVGKPLAVHLKNLGATVTVCDEFTKNLAECTKKAEVLVSATGVPRLIKKEMVKKGAIVIDVGSQRGDVDFGQVKKVASAITPVPGGIGPLTVVSLLENILLTIEEL